MVICASCGSENEAGQKFCDSCGAVLATACPACGAANRASALFCRECAASLRATDGDRVPMAAPDPAAMPVAERRVVSVMFADLVGFTTFAESRDAEETRELLSRYFEMASEVVGRFGGTIEKFIGDAVMALWGAPTAHEDDAERAVRAALELVAAVPGLAPGIEARAGVLTGEAAVTIGATNQGMVAGDLVNTAARLQSVAPSGGVLVGESTRRAAGEAIDFEPAGEHVLKGKASPVPTFLAVGARAEGGAPGPHERLEVEFVGKDDQLRLLTDLFHATARERAPRVVSIMGPAGVGKSRLVREFRAAVERLAGPVYWHSGRSPAYGDGITFWALGEMIRRRAGLAAADDEPTTRAKVSETVAAWIDDESERQWVESAILALLGIESGIGSEQLFAAWRTLFERIAATGTVVMAFEDLHWADPGTLDFIEHVLDWSKGVPILILTLARPELLEHRETWGAGTRNFSSIYLDPMVEPDMRELLARLVPGLPEAAAGSIIGRADGIPLYAVETVRMLIAEGRLREEAGVHIPVGDLTELAVPETLTALIASRLDALGAIDRALVQDAAVLGQSFTPAGLAAVSGMNGPELDRRLQALVRRELLVLDADPRSPERGQYAFVQALVREVAYHALARRDRKIRHLAAARFFESLGSDELAAALAGHYLAAHANAPDGPESAALAGQARITLRAAAERAGSLGGHDQAVTFLRLALTVATDPEDVGGLLERAADEASVLARYDQVEAFLGRAINLHRSRGDRRAVARATAALGRAFLGTYRTDAALALLSGAADEFADLTDDPGLVAVLGQLSRAYFFRQDPTAAIEWADRTLPAAERLDQLEVIADTLITRGSALVDLGRAHEGIGVLEVGLRLAETHGLVRTAFRARANLGGYLPHLIGPAAALASAREALAEARRLGLRSWVLGLVLNATGSAFATGDWDWVMGEFDDLLAAELEPEDRMTMLCGALCVRAWRGEPTSGLLAELEEMLARTTDPQIIGAVHDARGAVAFADGQLSVARIEFRARAASAAIYAPAAYPAAARAALWQRDAGAVEEDLRDLIALGIHGPMAAARRTVIEAGLAAVAGRSSEALALYRMAFPTLHDLGATWEAALAGMDMALLLDPSDPEVRAAAESSRAGFAALGARPFLERLERTLEGLTAAIGSPAS